MGEWQIGQGEWESGGRRDVEEKGKAEGGRTDESGEAVGYWLWRKVHQAVVASVGRFSDPASVRAWGFFTRRHHSPS
jgi:hypothetical protein